MYYVPLKDLSIVYLFQEKNRLEQRLIHGTASDDDINTYVTFQLELAQRETLDFLIDARD